MRYFQEPDLQDPNPFFPCGKCGLKVRNNHKAIQCDNCNYWTHIKCDGIDNSSYEKLKKSFSMYFCKICLESALPFQELNDDQFFLCQKGFPNEDVKSTCQLFPSHKINTLFKEINNFNQSNFEDESPSIDCKYYNADEIDNHFNASKFSLFHLNIASLGCHKDELEELLSIIEFKPDIIGLSETKILKGQTPIYDIGIEGYKNFVTPTESDKGGTIIYFNKNLNGDHRKDLDNLFYLTNKLESTFIEILNNNKKNIIVGCIYKHPSMDIDEFNSLFEILMEKLSNENKEIYLIGDFNLDLLKIDDENKIEEFYNIISSNLLVPHITIPTRITPNSKTLIDNIFSSNLDFLRAKSGNITVTISDHMPQFLLTPKTINRVYNKQKIYKRDTKNIDRDNLIADVININWDTVLEMNKCDPDYSFNNFDKKINEILDKYAPIKKLSKKELKGLSKPWITTGIRKSIKRRDKILNSYIKCKDNTRKEELHSEYKTLRNRIVSLIKFSKKDHYRNFFVENSKDIRKTWKGIKSIININNMNKGQPCSMLIDKEINSNPLSIANGFNNYFSSIAQNLQENINTTGSNFSDYLKNPSENSFFFQPVDSEEIIFIIDSIDGCKASGPHSIPTDILKMIKCNIGSPLREIINMSFEKGIYPNNLKTAKINPIYKNKGDPLQFKNYRPISLLSNINKIFEKLVYKRLYSFLNTYNCIYELQFGFRAKHSTNHALINLTEMVREALDSGKFAGGIFVDLQKAFDTVDHEILLNKLEYYGIRGIANKWFR